MADCDSSWLIDNLPVITALAGAGWGLLQYQRATDAALGARRREQAVTAANEMSLFLEKPDVKAALRMIDWNSGQIQVVDDEGVTRKLPFSRLILRLALRHHSIGRQAVEGYDPSRDRFLEEARAYDKSDEQMRIYFSNDEQAIRDIFDAFLSRLERMETLIECGVISDDLFKKHFGYWLKAMAENKIFDGSTTFSNRKTHRSLWNYIRLYQSEGVIRLFRRYGLTQDCRKAWYAGKS